MVRALDLISYVLVDFYSDQLGGERVGVRAKMRRIVGVIFRIIVSGGLLLIVKRDSIRQYSQHIRP